MLYSICDISYLYGFVLQDPVKAERCTGTLEKPLEPLTATPSTYSWCVGVVKYRTKCLSNAVSAVGTDAPVLWSVCFATTKAWVEDTFSELQLSCCFSGTNSIHQTSSHLLFFLYISLRVSLTNFLCLFLSSFLIKGNKIVLRKDLLGITLSTLLNVDV